MNDYYDYKVIIEGNEVYVCNIDRVICDDNTAKFLCNDKTIAIFLKFDYWILIGKSVSK